MQIYESLESDLLFFKSAARLCGQVHFFCTRSRLSEDSRRFIRRLILISTFRHLLWFSNSDCWLPGMFLRLLGLEMLPLLSLEERVFTLFKLGHWYVGFISPEF